MGNKPTPAAWVEEETLGKEGTRFAWTLDARGDVVVRVGTVSPVSRRFPREGLERLQRFMGDHAWHAATEHAEKALGTQAERSIEAFGRRQLGWGTVAARMAPHLAALFAHAGIWDWNEQRRAMMFRLRERGLEGLRDYFRRRGRGAARPTLDGAARLHLRTRSVPLHDLSATFRTLSRSLRARFEACLAGRHPTEKGQRREMALIEFLRSHLPARYGVTRGEVIASDGECSNQADVLIYDALRSPTLLASETSCLLAAESLYAAIEVKPRLRAADLVKAAANLRSIKALPRTALLRPYPVPVAESPEAAWARPESSRKRPACGLPGPSTSGTLVATAIRNRGYAIESAVEGPRSNPPVFGAVFAIESDPPVRLLQALEHAQRGLHPELWVDFVCILDQAVLHRVGGRAGPGWTSDFSAQPPPTRIARAGPDALLFFYLTLLQDINTKTLLPPDLEFYWQPG